MTARFPGLVMGSLLMCVSIDCLAIDPDKLVEIRAIAEEQFAEAEVAEVAFRNPALVKMAQNDKICLVASAVTPDAISRARTAALNFLQLVKDDIRKLDAGAPAQAGPERYCYYILASKLR
jgi:hypothetical protein